ncbi:uncharacterized protein RHIMIDRAFT_235884 [Rhizopus microsporus ATCC 52813]|uniref:Uncharacterized protein n=1 Tax=Rhizopus microsporus ATCC 52813 TaxID=1340429 RepID=A0A2G4SZQ2_RHIZD|nr:uncharacterized protein RHIMIDRAFT_235884 [Rhizopus microsporus ATCC 52813]PHZ13886.1 hypothetical protein RHIMIDRAFT_235884 [Rhizopus microsporus ATCC 52813]
MESEHNVQQSHLSPEQIEELYQQFATRFRIEEEEQRKHHQLTLPEAIQTDLEETPKLEMQSNIKKYIRDLPNYEGGDWTINETINKEFTPDIKRFQIDAYQALQSRYKDAERISNTAKAATDIYKD